MLDTRKILQENLKALLATRPDTSRLNLSREMKVGDGTLGSIQYGTGNPTLEILETIARFFELETWRLLSPNLGHSPSKSNRKGHAANLHHWPFAKVTAPDFDTLPRADKDEVEHQVIYKVKRFKEGRRRRKQT